MLMTEAEPEARPEPKVSGQSSGKYPRPLMASLPFKHARSASTWRFAIDSEKKNMAEKDKSQGENARSFST
ncbi:hypothetical protein [Sinorhizobium psoraleae]|uniref:hypothetical protein n=1 Tax=Sinorhizobium psoraleae TaxID=520838 RepID=UPI00156A16EF|nr:hypothetical protein [Sinorhizobium psoraleae]